MATCPIITDRKSKNEFNSIIKKFGGNPQTDLEFSIKSARNSRTGVDLISSKIAYYLWDLYEGNIDNIKESFIYNNSGIILYSLLSHSSAIGALSEIKESIPNINKKNEKIIFNFLKEIFKEISNTNISNSSLNTKDIQDILDSLAQNIVFSSLLEDTTLAEHYEKTLQMFIEFINSKLNETTEKLGIKISPLSSIENLNRVDFSITKEEFNQVLDEIGIDTFNKFFSINLYNVNSLIEKIKTIENINELLETEEFNNFVKYLNEEENRKFRKNYVFKQIIKTLNHINKQAEIRKINQVYLENIKKIKKDLDINKLNKKINIKKIQNSAIKSNEAKKLLEIYYPIISNIELFNTLLSKKVDYYAKFIGEEFSELILDLKGNMLNDEVLIEDKQGVLNLGYDDETLDYDKSHFEKELPIAKSARKYFLQLPSGKKSRLGSNIYIDPKIAYSIVRNILNNFIGDFDEAIKILRNHTDNFPWLNVLCDRLEELANTKDKNAFLVSMNSVYVNQYSVFFGDNKFGSRVVKVNDSAAITAIIKSWSNNIILLPFTNKDWTINTKQALDYVNEKLNPYAERLFNATVLARSKNPEKLEQYKKIAEEYVQAVKEVLEYLGIKISSNTLKITFESNGYAISIGKNKIPLKQFHTSNLSPLGLILNTFKSNEKLSVDELQKLFTETVFKNLARKEIKANPSLTPLSHTIGNKKQYSYVYPSYLSIMLSKINSDPEFLKSLLNSPYRSNNPWLNEILQIVEKINQGILDPSSLKDVALEIGAVSNVALQQFGEKLFSDRKFDELHESEHELFLATIMLSKITDHESGERKIFFNLPITSDKSTFYGVVAKEFNIDKSISDKISPSDLKYIYEVAVLPEINRMRFIRELVMNGTLDINSKEVIANSLFYLTPKLNYIKEIFDEEGFIIDDDEFLFETIAPYLLRELYHEINTKAEIYLKYNLLTKFSKDQLNSILGKELTDKVYNTKIDESKDSNIRASIKFAATILAKYVTLQSRLGYASIYTSILPDFSNYFTESAFKEAISVIKSVYPESNKLSLYRQLSLVELSIGFSNIQKKYNKRAAMFIANGKLLHSSGKIKYLFVNDKAVNSKMLEQLKVIIGEQSKEYSKEGLLKEATNAQEFITLEEYIRNKFYAGEISEKLYKTITNFYKELREKGYKEDYYDDFRQYLNEHNVLEEYDNLIINPQKPVYNWIDRNNITNDISPVYIKISSYPLLPNINSVQIVELRKLMEKNGIDRVSFPSGAKVGTTNKLLNLWDEDGNIRTDITEEELNQSVKELDRIGLREQQNVPFHGNKNLVNRSTQADKLLFIDLLKAEKLVFKGEVYHGKRLEKYYSSLYTKLYELEYYKLMDELEAEWDDSGKITYINIDLLRELAYNEAYDRGLSVIELEFLSDIKYVNFYPFLPISNKLEALINSLVKNRILKIKFPGNAFVLSSEEGYQKRNNVKEFDESIRNDDEIIYTDSFTGELSPGEYVDSEGNILTGEKLKEAFKTGEFITRKPAQVLIPWRFNINGKLIDSNYFIIEKDGKKYIDTEKIDPEVLKIFGYRIPNAGINNMSPIEIVGFLPEKYGDLVVASRDYITQMGSDFDVDKLYTYMSHLYITIENDKIVLKALHLDNLEEYKNLLEEVKKDINKNKETEDYDIPLSVFYNSIKEVNQAIKDAESNAIKGEIKIIHNSILTSGDKLVAYKTFIPTSYGSLKRLSEESIESTIDPSIALYSVYSDFYHKLSRDNANMGKNLISPYALANSLIPLLQKTKFTFPYPTLIIGEYDAYLNIGNKKNGYLECYDPLTIETRTLFIKEIMKRDKVDEKTASSKAYSDLELIFEYLPLDKIVFRSDVLGHQLQSALDNQNQDILGNLNINMNNVGVAITLTLLGYGEDLIGRIFRIPAVKFYYDAIKELSSSIQDEYLSLTEIKDKAFTIALEKLRKLYNINSSISDEEIFTIPANFKIIETKSKKLISFESLTNSNLDYALKIKEINEAVDVKLLIETNFKSLILIRALEPLSGHLYNILQSAKIDSSYFGTSYIEFLIKRSQFFNLSDYLGETFDITDSITKAAGFYGSSALEILYKHFYNVEVINFSDSLYTIKEYSNFDINNTNNLESYFKFLKSSYLIASLIYSEQLKDSNKTTTSLLNELLSRKDENSFINKLIKYKELLPNNLLLKSINIEKLTNDYYKITLGELPQALTNNLIDAINELYSYNEKIPELDLSGREIVENIIKSFILLGNHSGYYSVLTYVSPIIFEDMGILKAMQSKEFNDKFRNPEIYRNIKSQFLQYNPKYIKTVPREVFKVNKANNSEIFINIDSISDVLGHFVDSESISNYMIGTIFRVKTKDNNFIYLVAKEIKIYDFGSNGKEKTTAIVFEPISLLHKLDVQVIDLNSPTSISELFNPNNSKKPINKSNNNLDINSSSLMTINNKNNELNKNNNKVYKYDKPIKTIKDLEEFVKFFNSNDELILSTFTENSNMMLNIQRLFNILMTKFESVISPETFAILHMLSNSKLLDITPVFILKTIETKNSATQFSMGGIQLAYTEKDDWNYFLSVLTHELIHQLHQHIKNLIKIGKDPNLFADNEQNEVIFNDKSIISELIKLSSNFDKTLSIYFDVFSQLVSENLDSELYNKFISLTKNFKTLQLELTRKDISENTKIEIKKKLDSTYKLLEKTAESLINKDLGIDFSVLYATIYKEEFFAESLTEPSINDFINKNKEKFLHILKTKYNLNEESLEELISKETYNITKKIIYSFGVEDLYNNFATVFLLKGMDIISKLDKLYETKNDEKSNTIWKKIKESFSLNEYFDEVFQLDDVKESIYKKFELLDDDNNLLSLEDIGLISIKEQKDFLKNVLEYVKENNKNIYVLKRTVPILDDSGELAYKTYLELYNRKEVVTQHDINSVSYKEINDKINECGY